jgi:hypothetical protein
MADPVATPATATGVRVLKGAVVAVLGIPSGGTTFAYKFTGESRGTLGVKIPTDVEATPELLARIAALSPPLPAQLINADLHTDNVLVAGERVTGVLDFEFAAHDWRVMEFVVGVSKYCGAADPKPLLAAYAEGYREGGGAFTAVEVELLPELIIMRILNNVCVGCARAPPPAARPWAPLTRVHTRTRTHTHTHSLSLHAAFTLWVATWPRRTAWSPLQGCVAPPTRCPLPHRRAHTPHHTQRPPSPDTHYARLIFVRLQRAAIYAQRCKWLHENAAWLRGALACLVKA